MIELDYKQKRKISEYCRLILDTACCKDDISLEDACAELGSDYHGPRKFGSKVYGNNQELDLNIAVIDLLWTIV